MSTASPPGIGVRTPIYVQNFLCFAPIVAHLWDGKVTIDEMKDQSIAMMSGMICHALRALYETHRGLFRRILNNVIQRQRVSAPDEEYQIADNDPPFPLVKSYPPSRTPSSPRPVNPRPSVPLRRQRP